MLPLLSKKNKYLLAGLFIAFVSLIYTSCDITNPTKGLAVIFNTLSVQTSASVNFVDAATSQQIGLSTQRNVYVTITGPDKDKVVNQQDQSLTSATTSTGLLNIGIRNDVTPSPSNPIRINIVAQSDGYILTSRPVTIQSTGNRSLTINMVDMNNPPLGSIAAQVSNVRPNSSGQLPSPVTVQTNREPLSNGDASITINSGTTIRDASGNPLTGNLTVNATYFSNKSDQSTRSLPTGSNVSTITQSGNTQRGFFQVASFASYNVVNQSGQTGRNFSNPVNLSITLPSDTRNPQSQNNLRNGDAVPIWSYDESNGQWRQETTATAVGPDSRGNYSVSFPANHLSWWVAAWLQTGNQVCVKDSLVIDITGSYSALLLKVKAPTLGLLFETNVTSSQNHFKFEDVTLPANLPVVVEAYNLLECPEELVGSVAIPDLCSVSNIVLPVNLGSGRNDVEVNISASCRDRDPVLTIQPSGYNIFIKSCNQDINVGMLNNGYIKLGGLRLSQTESYTFAIEYKGKKYYKDTTVTQTSYNIQYSLDNETCSEF